MIDEADLAAQLVSGNQQTAEEFAAQVKGMTEEKAMESADQGTLTVLSDISLFHGFAPALAINLLAEAGRDFSLDAEWTPEDAILVSDWLREAQAKKRRAGSELPYEPDIAGAARISVPLGEETQVTPEFVVEPEIIKKSPPTPSSEEVLDLSINFETSEQAKEFIATLKSTGVSLGKPGGARVMMKISGYNAQAAIWQDL